MKNILLHIKTVVYISCLASFDQHCLVMKGVLLLVCSFSLLANGDLSDFGGDVRQYMSLLQGSSAFSFDPKTNEDGKKLRETESPMGEFGGDYGDYLKLLESNSALGFNPQADPIGDNQDLQNDV